MTNTIPVQSFAQIPDSSLRKHSFALASEILGLVEVSLGFSRMAGDGRSKWYRLEAHATKVPCRCRAAPATINNMHDGYPKLDQEKFVGKYELDTNAQPWVADAIRDLEIAYKVAVCFLAHTLKEFQSASGRSLPGLNGEAISEWTRIQEVDLYGIQRPY